MLPLLALRLLKLLGVLRLTAWWWVTVRKGLRFQASSTDDRERSGGHKKGLAAAASRAARAERCRERAHALAGRKGAGWMLLLLPLRLRGRGGLLRECHSLRSMTAAAAAASAAACK